MEGDYNTFGAPYATLPNGITPEYTTGAVSTSGYGIVPGTADTYESVKVKLTDIPNHTIARVSVDEAALYGTMLQGGGDSDPDTIKVEAGGQSETATWDHTMDPVTYEPNLQKSAHFGRWFTHTSDEIEVTVSGQDLESGDLIFPDIEIQFYEPVVSISGGGATDEDNAGTADFTVSRDSPAGWGGTSVGDAASPAVHVDLHTEGTATEDTDYTLEPDVQIPSQSNGNDPAFVAVPLTVLDDTEAEGVETVLASVAHSDAYEAASGQATSTIDDNISVQSIDVVQHQWPADSAGAPHHDAYGYYFENYVKLVGEHLDRVRVTQLIRSKTQLWDYNGTLLDNDQTLAALTPNPSSAPDPNVINTNGNYKLDTGWKPDTVGPQDLSNHNGIAYIYDKHHFDVDSKQATVATGIVKEGRVAVRTLDFSFEVVIGPVNTVIKTHDWGFTWDNLNAIWSVNGNPAAPDPYCVLDDAGKHGEFSGVYGIDSVPWF